MATITNDCQKPYETFLSPLFQMLWPMVCGIFALVLWWGQSVMVVNGWLVFLLCWDEAECHGGLWLAGSIPSMVWWSRMSWKQKCGDRERNAPKQRPYVGQVSKDLLPPASMCYQMRPSYDGAIKGSINLFK